jgi:hypothetical protein
LMPLMFTSVALAVASIVLNWKFKLMTERLEAKINANHA